MTSQVVRVRRETLTACMTCPLCNKLLRDATTISECLHTFCRKCIYDKLTDEEEYCCPMCNIDLGCTPVEKLRTKLPKYVLPQERRKNTKTPDHNLQDVRAKIFPFKRRKVNAPEAVLSVPLPVRIKERSLSSLGVNTPRVSTQTGLTGRRTKAVARKAAALRSNFTIEEHVKKEEDLMDDCPESSSSPETLNKFAQNRRLNSSTTKLPNHHMPIKDRDNGAESWAGKVDLWKPLNTLVEAANRTKSFKSGSHGAIVKSEPINGSSSEEHAPKSKMKEHGHKLKGQEDRNGSNSSPTGSAKPRKLHGMRRKRASASREQAISAQAVLDAAVARSVGRISPIWFSLVASEDQEGDAALPQISSCYLRIKDGNVPVSLIQKYLVKKLNLMSEAEVEILCHGQPVVPTLQLHNLIDLWLRTASTSQRVAATVSTSAKDFVMVLAYARKVQAP